jgi:hypothetical protein
MIHVLYAGDVHPDESITKADRKALKVARVKLKSGHYAVVAYDTEEALADFVASGDAAYASTK